MSEDVRCRLTMEMVLGDHTIGRAQMTFDIRELFQHPLVTRAEDLHLVRLQRAAIKNAEKRMRRNKRRAP